MGTLTPEAGSVGRLLRVPLAESGLPGIRAVSVFPPGDLQGELTRSGKCRNGRHPFYLYSLYQNGMSRKTEPHRSALWYSGVFSALLCARPFLITLPNAEPRAFLNTPFRAGA